jgi:hypothetical protein
LNAVDNKWFVDGQVESDPADISARFGTEIPDAIRVKFEPVTSGATACTGVPSGGAQRLPIVIAVEGEGDGMASSAMSLTVPPTATYLGRPRPSPSAGFTEIPFGIAGVESRVCRLKVYGVDGRLVRILVEDVLAAGHYQQRWDGFDPSGSRVAPGVYFVRLEAGEFSSTEKLVRLK